MKIATSTWLWLAAAAASMVLVYGVGADDEAASGFVSTKSAARRVFDALSDVGPADVEVELRATDGAAVRLVQTSAGHAVEVDGQIIGPADPDALDGLVDSLRLATTLRAVADDTEVGAGRRGTIVVSTVDGRVELEVRSETPDRVGHYGIITEGDASSTWVVERDVAMILDQEPVAWLARRAVVVEPGEVTAVDLPQASLRRGPDGLWRSRVGEQTALLSTEAVEARLSRLVTARLDPMRPPTDAAAQPWITLRAEGNQTFSLALQGPCPGAEHRVVLSRGAGWTGCIDEAVMRAWPLPGSGADNEGAMVEPRLLPYGYGSVLSIEQSRPARRTLSRRVGDWVLESEGAGTKSVTELDGAAVFDWYGRLHEAEVNLGTAGEYYPAEPPSVIFEVRTDTTVSMTLSCWEGAPARCRRDDGPVVVLRDELPELAFDAETFADRRLFTVTSDQVRAVEILPGPGADAIRHSVHFDLGVWRLDAPTHPDGDEALSEPALEDLLAAIGSMRAVSWTPQPSSSPLRQIRVETTVQRDGPSEIELQLHDGCVVGTGDRFARVSKSTCETLGRDLLHDDPFDFWLRTARTVEVDEGGRSSRLKRSGEVLVVVDGAKPPWLQERLDELAARRSTRLGGAGQSGAAPLGTLRVLPARGAAFVVEYGEDWARVQGAAWSYRFDGGANANADPG